ncbi:MAG: endonuclease/exonuclease/phosphatase family protein [Candidatus Brocadiia bacterium]
MAEPRAQQPLRTTFWRLVALAAAVGCVPTVLALGARRWWVLELAAHFRVYYAAGLAACAALLAAGRRLRLALLPALFAAWNAALVAPRYAGRPPARGAGPRLRLLSANVATANRQHRRFLDAVAREEPDLVLVMEVNAAWAAALQPLREAYPHVIERVREDNFGIAFYSRLPVERLLVRRLGGSGVPAVVARLSLEGTALTVLGVHTLPPVSRRYARTRNAQLADAAALAAGRQGPVVLVGDLNATPWSPHFADLLRRSGLRDTARGYGVQPTWRPLPLLALPIDHLLASEEVAVLDRRVLPPVGSDHRPLVADLGLEAPSAAP